VNLVIDKVRGPIFVGGAKDRVARAKNACRKPSSSQVRASTALRKHTLPLQLFKKLRSCSFHL
jgi:hypothetical protein